MEQQDSATLLLKSCKSLLQMHETENYCKQTSETKSDISKYWAICVLQLFVNQADVLKFEISLDLFNQPFSIHDQRAFEVK